MASVHQDILSAACRTMYHRAGETYMLPELLRAAGGELPTRRIAVETVEGSLVVVAQIDPALTDRNLHAAEPLPLKLAAHMERDGETLRLCRRQRDELIRAFLLGAKAPISLEPAGASGCFRLSVQIAPRYACGCGEIEASTGSREDLARALADALYQRTAHYFADPNNGRAVWDIRAAQELFGDPRPAAEAFWPVAAPEEEAAEDAPPVAKPVQAPSRLERYRRVAIAAGIATLALGASVYVGANRSSHLNPAQPGGAAGPERSSAKPVEDASMPPVPHPGVAPAADRPTPITPPMMLGAPPPLASPTQSPVRKIEPAKTRVASARPSAPARPPIRTSSATGPSSAKIAIAKLNGVVRDIERLPQRIAAVVRTSQTH